MKVRNAFTFTAHKTASGNVGTEAVTTALKQHGRISEIQEMLSILD